MAVNEFSQFLQQQSEEAGKTAQTAQQRLEHWLVCAGELVGMAEDFLKDYSHQVSCERREQQLKESYLGSYSVPKLLIRLPSELIELEAVGADLIGARGRYDLKGLAGTVKLVLVPESAVRPGIKASKDAESAVAEPLVWKVQTPGPDIRFVDLDQQVFLEAIMEISHG